MRSHHRPGEAHGISIRLRRDLVSAHAVTLWRLAATAAAECWCSMQSANLQIIRLIIK